MAFPAIYSYCRWTRVLHTVAIWCSQFVYSNFLYLFWPSNVLFPPSSPSLSSGADHAVRRRDERCHRARWDNPVAVHSGWLKGTAEHKYTHKKRKETTSTYAHTMQAGCSRLWVSHSLLFLAFIARNTNTSATDRILRPDLRVVSFDGFVVSSLFLNVHFCFAPKVSLNSSPNLNDVLSLFLF